MCRMNIEVTIKCACSVLLVLFLVFTHETPKPTAGPAVNFNPVRSRIVLNTTKLDYGYCHSSPAEIDEGTKSLLDILNRITVSPYFRYFKVNSAKPCPYWAVSLLCTSAENTCDVCKCDENSIPEALRADEDMSELNTPDGSVAKTVLQPVNLDDWGDWLKADDGAEYVDLASNPEGNTGYSGPLAAQVWRAIYAENCLSSDKDGTCQELSILRTLLSGLHMSINIHVCTSFYKDPELSSPQRNAGIYNNPNISFFPNCQMYNKRIAPFPDFVGNLYILYQFTLRALAKSRSFFTNDVSIFNTGARGEATLTDLQLHDNIKELFNSRLICSPTFDEGAFLESEKGRSLIPQFKAMMLNVTRLMDCVTCEKCRIWGKLETKGIAVAMKVIMNPENERITLDRSEMVTLVNLARQLAFSVRNAQRLGSVCSEDDCARGLSRPHPSQ